MSFRQCFPAWAFLGLALTGISSANAADYGAGGNAAGSQPKPPIVDARSVESADYQTYVGNLQALGFPPATIRSIVTTDVVGAFAGKRAEAVAARYGNFQYWQSHPAETEARATLAAQRRAIDEEMNRVLQQLLGTDTELPDVSRAWQREAWNHELAFLAPAKLEATQAILAEYAPVNRQMMELAGGLNLSEDTNALQQILGRYREEQSNLQRVLAPEEYQRVEMTTSGTAENLRHALVHFEPTEAEFRIIFEAWHPHDENLSRLHATRQSDPGNLEQVVHARIQAQLSAPRYEQYRATWWK